MPFLWTIERAALCELTQIVRNEDVKRISSRRVFLFVVAVFALIAIADQGIARMINCYILDQDAYFEERFSAERESLSFSGDRRQGCQISRAYAIYTYQTCFSLRKDNFLTGGPAFLYQYHEVRPVIGLPFRRMPSQYFEEDALSLSLKVIDDRILVIYEVEHGC